MFLQKAFEKSPIVARVAPYALFLLLTYFQGKFGEASRYWFYFAKSVVGAWLLLEMRPFVKEMRLAFSWEAVAVGVGVWVMWVGLDGFYPKLSELPVKFGLAQPPATPSLPWNPNLQFGEGTTAAWLFIVVRILGASLVVPAMEEVFFRSFMYRYFAKTDFQSLPLGTYVAMPFFVTALVFASAHEEWLAGILCGFAYQGLVIWKNRLGDAIVAHGITNLLLGVWVVWKGAWNFW